MKDRLFLASRYLRFLYNAKGRFTVHSPYIYQIIDQVIRPGSPAAVCAPVEELRNRLKRNHTVINKTDYGSGSGDRLFSQYPTRLSHVAKHSSLPAGRAGRLFYLARFLEARKILEFGTSLGMSAGYMAKAVPGASIVTMEGCPEVARLARENMSELAIENVQILEGSFDERLPEALQQLKAPDLVFFDGNHRYEPTIRYFRQCMNAAHNSTVFVFDDIHYSREMERAWEKIISSPEVTVSIDLFHQGWVLIREELSPQHFILNYP